MSRTLQSRQRASVQRTHVHAHQTHGRTATIGPSEAKWTKIVGLVLLAGLMGLTSWVVASLATWLVPLYVIGMVLIFVSPRSRDTHEFGHRYPDSILDANVAVADQLSGTSRLEPSFSASLSSADNSAGIQGTDSIPVGSTSARTRRSPARSRKQVNPGILTSADASRITWIRVGPGKFVRADSQRYDSSVKYPTDASSEVLNPTCPVNSEENLPQPCDLTEDLAVRESSHHGRPDQPPNQPRADSSL